MVEAVHRRVRQELGIGLTEVTEALPDFRYRAVSAEGIVENEFCPVFVAITDFEPEPVESEVSEYAWATPQDLADAVQRAPFAFSPWLVSQIAEPELQAQLG